MAEDDCKVQMKDSFKFYLPINGENNNRNRKYLITTAGFLLIITLSILIGFTFQFLNDIHHLKQDIETLKKSVEQLKPVLSLIEDYTYNPDDENGSGLSQAEKNSINDDYNEYSYFDGDDIDDEDIDDEGEDLFNTIPYDNTHILLTGGQFTKDLKTGKTDENNREKRNVVGYTQDGVPINSESLLENFTHPPGSHHSSRPRSRVHPIYRRRHRVMSQEDNSKPLRRVAKKSSLKSGDYRSSQEDSETEFTIIRRPEPHLGRMRPLPAAHYSGDTSKYDPSLHPHYKGNGHLRHPHGIYTDWAESSWVKSLGMDQHFTINDGVVTIKEPGVYFVYAQIFHLDEHDTSGFKICKNDEILIQCTATAHSVRREYKGNTCYTAAASYLENGDKISLKDLSVSHYSLFVPGMSFFGLIKLGDVQIK